ncbi:hypothetical protein ACRYI5_03450 [Furfurilactobacillus sp. WILCCON 0119]
MEKGQKRNELAKKIVNDLKEKDLLETEAVSVLRKSISIIEELKDQHKLR